MNNHPKQLRSLISILTFIVITIQSFAQTFTSWSDYEYFNVIYLPNPSKIGDGKSFFLSDTWNHVGETKSFLADKVGVGKILPENFEDWPKAAKDFQHRVLHIQVWAHGSYRQVGFEARGTSYTYWRYLNLTHLVKFEANPDYTGQLLTEEIKASVGLNTRLNRDHARIQENWQLSHENDKYSYNQKSESAILLELESLGYAIYPEIIIEPELTEITADSLKMILKQASEECIIGLYRKAPGSDKQCGNYRFGVIEDEGELTAIISKEIEMSEIQNWKEGEVKARFIRTAAPSFFIVDWKGADRSDSEGFAECEEGMLTIKLESNDGSDNDSDSTYIKTFPLSNSASASNEAIPAIIGNASGAGSAVVVDHSSQFVVTNFHVVDGASSFAVVQGGKLFKAALLKTDENNDLALLRITEEGINLRQIPISIDDKLGDRVYSAGYPRVFEMGDEIKITEGVISSMSFLSDPSKFQTSVPITNGNSGGALLDENGNLVGITQGGWRPDANTENVNAAVKSLYLISLAQTESTCNISLSQNEQKVDFSSIEESVLPLFVYD